MNAENLQATLDLLGWIQKGKMVRGKNYLVSCPFAYKFHKKGTDNSPSMAVKVDPIQQSVCICNSCGVKGSLLSIIWKCVEDEQIESDIYQRAKLLEIPRLEGMIDVQGIRSGQRGPQIGHSAGTPRDWKSVADKFDFGKVLPLIFDRGLTKATVRQWGIGYDPAQGRTVFRVTSAGGTVGFVSRFERNGGSEYPAYPGFAKSEYLYGEDKLGARRKMGAPVLLVEGMIDTPWVWQETKYPALGAFGINLSGAQVEKLKEICEHGLVIFFDNDRAGAMAIERAAAVLQGRIQGGCWTVDYPRRGKGPDAKPGKRPKDPNALSADQIRVCVENRKFLC